jgi:hypothetical protein
LQPNGEGWLHAAEHDVTIVIEALKLLPGKTDTHGLEGIGEYLQQVQDLLSDSKQAVEAAVPPSLVDEVANAVDDLTEDVVQSTKSTKDSVAHCDSNIDDHEDESVDKIGEDLSKEQKVKVEDTRENTGPNRLAEAPVEGGDMLQDAVQEQAIDETSAFKNGQRDNALV